MQPSTLTHYVSNKPQENSSEVQRQGNLNERKVSVEEGPSMLYFASGGVVFFATLFCSTMFLGPKDEPKLGIATLIIGSICSALLLVKGGCRGA